MTTIIIGLDQAEKKRQGEGWAVGMKVAHRWIEHGMYVYRSYNAWLSKSKSKEFGDMLSSLGLTYAFLSVASIAISVIFVVIIFPFQP